ncbi:MAG TPA: hypothetical protein VNJ12_06640 [Candidatus Dormibacteraeota bacterium]|nr:hypothetical protein [Candidatus Dormibacteraeota bacterium]
MAEQASFTGAAWPVPPPPLTLTLPFPRFRPEIKSGSSGEIPPAVTEVSAGVRGADLAQAGRDGRMRLAAEKRRAYNREYMRAWRERNLEHYRAKNREYQRRTAQRRKLRRIAQAAENAPALCAFGCGRPATATVERVDPRTWKSSAVPYCGKC